MGSLMQQYAPTPTDYSDDDNWAIYYDRGSEVDTFYLYPTMGHMHRDELFCEASDLTMRINAFDITPTQIMPWMWQTNVYAPYYRQAAFAALLPLIKAKEETRAERIAEAEALAREEMMDDIFASLDYFFEHFNEGRPFFLVAHSQGSMLMKNALEVYRAQHPEYFERMIAAYCPGWTFSQEWCERVGLPFCTGPRDTGVLISWNSERPSGPGDFNPTSVPDALCINPITWDSSELPSPLDESKGCLVVDPDKVYEIEMRILQAYTVDIGYVEDPSELDEVWLKAARCDEEYLTALADAVKVELDEFDWKDPEKVRELWDWLNEPDESELDPPFAIRPGFVRAWYNRERGTLSVEFPGDHTITPRALGEKSLHMMDFMLFSMDLRLNIAERIEAWKETHAV